MDTVICEKGLIVVYATHNMNLIHRECTVSRPKASDANSPALDSRIVDNWGVEIN